MIDSLQYFTNEGQSFQSQLPSCYWKTYTRFCYRNKKISFFDDHSENSMAKKMPKIVPEFFMFHVTKQLQVFAKIFTPSLICVLTNFVLWKEACTKWK